MTKTNTCDISPIKKLEERKEFCSLLLKTVLPLLIQAVFMQSINFIDQIMVSSLGTAAVAAVGASNKLLSLYNSFLYGSCSGCAMFMQQYWGKKDMKGFQRIMGITLTATVTMGTVVTAMVLIAPGPLLSMFNSDPEVMAYGIKYMRMVAPAYFLMGITFPLNYVLRSMNKVKITMTSTCLSVFLNCVANYLFIFGSFGFPRLGVGGAAIGTTITRIVEFAFLTTYFVATKCEVFKNFKNIFGYGVDYVKGFIQKSIPLIGNEMLWSLGTTIYFIIYGQTGTDALAAMSIMQTLQMLSKIVSGGFCGASSIIIGNEIGKGDEAKVNRFCHMFHICSVGVGVVQAVFVLAIIHPILSVFNITGTQVGVYVTQCMYILAIHTFFNPINSINVEGIFRSGGDVAYLTLMDMGSIWLIGMPWTLVTGVVLHMDIVYIYCAYIVLEIYKLPLGYIRFRSGKWLHRLHEVGAKSSDESNNREESMA